MPVCVRKRPQAFARRSVTFVAEQVLFFGPVDPPRVTKGARAVDIFVCDWPWFMSSSGMSR